MRLARVGARISELPGALMEFVFSSNFEVKKYLNPSTGKISPGGNFTAFNENWVSTCASAQQAADQTAGGAGLCAAVLVGGKRSAGTTGFIKAGFVIIDIDNQADGKDADGNKVKNVELTVEQALNLDICKKYLSFAYYSPSNTPDWPRFRLVFGLEEPITRPDFYHWFLRQIAAQIPGSDKRATQAVNLFYGGRGPEDLICVTDNYIPEDVISDAARVFATLPQNAGGDAAAEDALTCTVAPDGCRLDRLVSQSVRSMLDGEPVEDRSLAMAVGLKEIIGWTNWLNKHNVASTEHPLDVAHRLFYGIYEYAPELDGKFNRILNSITDPGSLQPAAALAAEDPEISCWKRVKSANRAVFAESCPASVKDRIKQKKSKPKNSVLSMNEFSLEASTPTSTSISTPEPMTATTPQTPAQLINIQNGDRTFSENDIAEVISSNYGDDFLYDSSLDEFFTFDPDEGVWFLSDEQHIKRRILKALDTFVQTGILQRYTSGTVQSIFLLLKARMLRSMKGGRQSIWTSNKGKVAFSDGVLDVSTLEFTPGLDREHYFRSRLGFKYSDNPNCPNFLSWLSWAVEPDNVTLIRAFCRAVLVGYSTGERFLHLIGAGGSGKSTLQQVLIALAGYTGTHTSDLETIETNRFEGHSLIGKRLLLLTDEATFCKRLDTLKKLTSSSDTLRAERKYGKEVINFKPELLVSIASNEHISSSDLSSGLERRRLTIFMNKVCDPSKRRNLLSVFHDHMEGEFVDELPNIAAWALDMGHDLMRETLANPTKFSPSLTHTNLEALVFNNPIVAWLAECTMYAPNSYTTLGPGALKPNVEEQERGLYVKNAFTEVYASYSNFVKCNGFRNIAKPRFIDKLKETATHVLKISGVDSKFINGKAVITGLLVKPYDPMSDPRNRGSNRLPSPVEFAADPNSWDAAFAEHDPPKQQSPVNS